MFKKICFYVMFPCLGLFGASCERSTESPSQLEKTSATVIEQPESVIKSRAQRAPAPVATGLGDWHEATPEKRDIMAEKFVADGSLLGMVEDEVEAQLGKPDFRSERLMYSFEFGEKLEGATAPSLILNLDCEGLVETAGEATYPRGLTPEPFDEDKWKSGTERERFYMAPALAKSKRLIGMTQESALELLGEPTKRTLPQIAYYSRTRNERGAGAGPNRKLIIKFNESYVVDKVIYTQK